MKISEGKLGTEQKRIRMPICDHTTSNEISNDYILPDYYPEIRRILNVHSTVMPPAKYVNAGGAEFSGIVDYSVLYEGADGNLFSAPFSAEYNINSPIDTDSNLDFNEGITSFSDIVVERITTRLTGPRKINIKCKIKAHSKAYATMLINERISGEVNPLSIQRLDKTEKICNLLHTTGEVLELSEEIIPEASDFRVIYAQGNPFVSELNVSDASVNVRGEIYLNLLTENEGIKGNTSQIQRRIPFSQNIELDDLTKGSPCLARACVSDISVNLEDGRIICDIGVILDILAQNENEFSYTKDIYSTENTCEASYRTYKIPTSKYCTNGNFSMNERLSKENIGFPENATIIDAFGSALADKIYNESGKNIVSGQAKYTILVLSDDEYSTVECLLPFKYEFDGQNAENAQAITNVIFCRVRQDADSVSIDAELCVSTYGMGFEEVTALSEASFGNSLSKAKGEIIICYPSSDDSVWSVAKKYNVPTSKIEEANEISSNKLDKKYLII